MNNAKKTASDLLYDAQHYGVKVLTWGSDESPYSNLMKGHNPGHAALQINIPASEETKALIDKFKDRQDKIQVRDLGNRGYQIYFSVWPSNIDVSVREGETWQGKVVQSQKGYDRHEKKLTQDTSGAHFNSYIRDCSSERSSAPEDSKVTASAYNEAVNKDYAELLKQQAVRNAKIFGKKTGGKYTLSPLVTDPLPEHIKHIPIENEENPMTIQFLIDYISVGSRTVEMLESEIIDLKRSNSGVSSEEIKVRMSDINSIMNRIFYMQRALDSLNLERYAAIGKKPDNVDFIPLKHQDSDIGLDLSAMLNAMADIAEEYVPFELFTKNCSSTSTRVIAAGMVDPRFEHFKKQFLDLSQADYSQSLYSPSSVHQLASDVMKREISIIQQFISLVRNLISWIRGVNKDLQDTSSPVKFSSVPSDENGNSVLHQLILQDSPKEVITKVLDADPLLLEITNADGLTATQMLFINMFTFDFDRIGGNDLGNLEELIEREGGFDFNAYKSTEADNLREMFHRVFFSDLITKMLFSNPKSSIDEGLMNQFILMHRELLESKKISINSAVNFLEMLQGPHIIEYIESISDVELRQSVLSKLNAKGIKLSDGDLLGGVVFEEINLLVDDGVNENDEGYVTDDKVSHHQEVNEDTFDASESLEDLIAPMQEDITDTAKYKKQSLAIISGIEKHLSMLAGDKLAEGRASELDKAVLKLEKDFSSVNENVQLEVLVNMEKYLNNKDKKDLHKVVYEACRKNPSTSLIDNLKQAAIFYLRSLLSFIYRDKGNTLAGTVIMSSFSDSYIKLKTKSQYQRALWEVDQSINRDTSASNVPVNRPGDKMSVLPQQPERAPNKEGKRPSKLNKK